MLDALAEFFPSQAEWTQPGGGLFIWATLPEFIDTGDLLAKAIQQENVAFVPGEAAFVDGRGGSSMRLNFSAVGEDDIVEGIRRIGKVIDQQISLYGTISGRRSAPAESTEDSGAGAKAGKSPPREDEAAELAEVVELPRRPAGTRRGAGGS
jgi:2-aminoadipate transaminase